MKERKTASIAIIASFTVTIFLVVLLLWKTSGSTIHQEYDMISISVIDELRSEDGAKCHVTGHFSIDIAKDQLLYFYPDNIEVKFWVNDKLVYEFPEPGYRTTSTPGNTIAMLDLGEVLTSDTVEFELYDPWYSYKEDRNAFDPFLGSFVIGNGQSIYQYLLHDKWIGIVTSVVIMFMGIVFFTYTMIYYFGHYADADINFAFSMMAFTAGAYILAKSLGNLLPLLISNPIWCSFLKIMSLYCMLASVVTYLYISAGGRVIKMIIFVFTMMSWVMVISSFALEVLGTVDMYANARRVLYSLTVLMVLAMAVGLVGVGLHGDFQTKRFALCLIPTGVMAALTWFYYWRFGKDVNDLAYIGALATLLLIALGIASDARVAQLSMAWMNREIIHKKEELDKAMEYISESKRRTAKLISEKEVLETQNQIDPMTGLFNKVALNRLITEYLDNNNAENVVLIFIDLDHFKTLNDTLGHATGDVAIKDAGKKLRSSFRQYDLVGRFGGDEFCVFMKNIKMEPLLNKLNDLMESLRRTYTDGTNCVNITGSVGCIYCQKEKATYQELFDLADKAVYDAKEQGRNRFVVKILK